ncbi:hypothetical protein PENSPDRAFT_737863 [Peniophora sp. CONT]|nr:hypothetical protein PENSPDRAFT_737863 [Peniophora sp. CONT]
MDRVTQWLSRICTFSVNSAAFRPIKQAWPKIGSFPSFNSLSLPSGMNAMSTQRRRPREIWADMSLTHFKFVWQHTSRQLIDADANSFGILLQSTLEVLGLIPRWRSGIRHECLDHLLRDGTLASRLDIVGRLRIGSPDSDTRGAVLKLICLLLCRSYTKPDMWKADIERSTFTIRHYLWVLFGMIRDPEDDEEDKPYDLLVQYCLYQLRWSCLLMARDNRVRSVSQFDLTRFNEVYFSEDHIEDSSFKPFYEHWELLEHPEALLLLLNSWQYNELDSVEPRSSRGDWTTDASSCVVPLHNAACCTRRDGPLEHVAACTVLTMIAHLLRASGPDRDALLQDHLWQYSFLWDHELPLPGWDHGFKISIEDRQRAPSAEFLSVLREAGLERWIETGDLQHLPPVDTPTGKFLAYFPGTLFADSLRALIECVDMSGGRSSLPGDFQWLLHASSTSPSAGPNEEGQYQPILGVAGEVPISDNAVNIHNAAELKAVYLPHRGSSFDLERVVIDTAVGISSSHPSGHKAITSEHSRAFVSATLEEDHSVQPQADNRVTQPNTGMDSSDRARARERGPLELNDLRFKQQDRAAEAAGTHPARANSSPNEHETSASSGKISKTEIPGIGHAEREEGGGVAVEPEPSASRMVADQENESAEGEGVRDGEGTGQQEKGKGR